MKQMGMDPKQMEGLVLALRRKTLDVNGKRVGFLHGLKHAETLSHIDDD